MEAGIVEELPLAPLHVHLDEVGSLEVGKGVDGRDLLTVPSATRREPRDSPLAKDVVPRRRLRRPARLARLPPARSAATQQSSPSRLPGIGFECGDLGVGELSKHVNPEEADVRPEIHY